MTNEATSEEIVTVDANGNIIDVTTVNTDSMYQDTVEFIREPADSTFSIITDGQTIGPLKYNEDRIYNFVNTRQQVDLDIEIIHDAAAQSLELMINDNPDADRVGQSTILKKYRFEGTRQ